jgi:hypothetical protein
MHAKQVVNKLFDTRLFRRDLGAVTVWQIVVWWELRRIPYNLLVGATGLGTVISMVITAMICDRLIGVPIGMPDPPVIAVLGILAYGIMANVCFTAGWIFELLLARAGMLPPRFAQTAFCVGLLGSILLTLLPAVITVISVLLQLMLRQSA